MKYLVILKHDPYYIYSNSEEDATKLAAKYGENNVVGIAYAEGGLELMELHTQVMLRPKEIKQITQYVTTYQEGEKVIQEVPQDEDDLEDDEDY